MIDRIELKPIPAQLLVCLRERGPVRELGARAQRLEATLRDHGIVPAGPLQARFFDTAYDSLDTDYDVCLPVAAGDDEWVPDTLAGLPTALVPAHHAMVATHHGPYATLDEAHEALGRELAAVGYALAGPVTEVFLEGPAPGRSSADYLTEVRYPIAR